MARAAASPSASRSSACVARLRSAAWPSSAALATSSARAAASLQCSASCVESVRASQWRSRVQGRPSQVFGVLRDGHHNEHGERHSERVPVWIWQKEPRAVTGSVWRILRGERQSDRRRARQQALLPAPRVGGVASQVLFPPGCVSGVCIHGTLEADLEAQVRLQSSAPHGVPSSAPTTCAFGAFSRRCSASSLVASPVASVHCRART